MYQACGPESRCISSLLRCSLERVSPKTHLSRNHDLILILKPLWTLALVRIIKDDGDARPGDASITALVDEVYEVLGSETLEGGDTEDEADGVEDVGLAGSILIGLSVSEPVRGEVGQEEREKN